MNTVLLLDQEPSTSLSTTRTNSLSPIVSNCFSQIEIIQNRKAFFQTTKDVHHKYQNKKKFKFYATKEEEYEAEAEEIEDKKKKNLPKNYLQLLINSVDKIMKNEGLTMEYLNSKTIPKMHYEYEEDNFSKEEDSQPGMKSCENIMCAVNVENDSGLYLAKFNHSNSSKCESLFLCKKCFVAFKSQNYCFYCNAIYREFQFNEQYFDTKKWIMCEYCDRWQHMECEERKGAFKNIERLANDKSFKYICPFCRMQNNSSSKKKHSFEDSKNFYLI
ncbi:MAG: hypothetical protein MJ252_25205 [archaeon]|nr:hypothetical protein [archaeon]